ARYGPPSKLIEVVVRARLLQGRGRDRANDVDEMVVVAGPQGHQGGPGGLLVPLPAHPGVLGVPWKGERVPELRFHETPVVVGGGVDQVTDDLLDGPLAGRGTSARLSV